MANVLDFDVAVITITIQYLHIDGIMCWCTLCMCVRAFGEIDLARIILK